MLTSAWRKKPQKARPAMHNNYLYILIMFAVTYAIRVVPMTLIRKPIENRFVKSFLYYVPYVQARSPPGSAQASSPSPPSAAASCSPARSSDDGPHIAKQNKNRSIV